MQWYYVEGEARIGPLAVDEMGHLIEQGRIGPQTPVWRKGLQGWEDAARHFIFAAPSGADMPPPVPGYAVPGTAVPGGRQRRLDSYTPPERAPAQDRAHRQTGPDGLYIHAPSRGFGEAITVCFRRYFGFSGRASRSEYWYFVLFTVLLGIVTGLLDSVFFGVAMADDAVGPLNGLTSLAVVIPTFAVAWRRLHDTGRSGWWIGGFFLATIGGGALIGLSMGTAAFSPAGFSNAMLLFGALMVGVVIYFIVMLVFMCTRGDPGPNRFG